MTDTSARPVAFVMDPMERVNILTDTSFALMREVQSRGFPITHVNPADISLEGDRVYLRGRRVEVVDDPERCYRVLDAGRSPADAFKAIFIRTDPPFDQQYLNATWLLSFARRAGVRVVNNPDGLRDANEKLYALEFVDLCPETLVTASLEDAKAFMEKVGGEAVAKPLDGHGGLGVMRLRSGDSNVNAIAEVLSDEGREPFIVQRYLPEAKKGDRRLFMVDGELIAVLKRTPADGDHRGNVHVGGKTTATEIDANDRLIAERVGPRLRQDGLLFAGLDVIAGKLIEVNVTSPTLIQELARHGGPDLAKLIVDKALA